MHILDDLENGTVRCVFSSMPLETINDLLTWGTTRPDGERVVVCAVDASRPVYEAIEELVGALANAALTVWPDWYGAAGLFVRCDERSLQSVLDRRASSRAATRQRFVLRPWSRVRFPCVGSIRRPSCRTSHTRSNFSSWHWRSPTATSPSWFGRCQHVSRSRRTCWAWREPSSGCRGTCALVSSRCSRSGGPAGPNSMVSRGSAGPLTKRERPAPQPVRTSMNSWYSSARFVDGRTPTARANS